MKVFSNSLFFKSQKRYFLTVVFSALALLLGLTLLTSCCFTSDALAKITSDTKILNSDSIEKILKDASSYSKAYLKDGNEKLVWQPSSVMDISISQSEQQNVSQSSSQDTTQGLLQNDSQSSSQTTVQSDSGNKYFEIGKPLYFKATGKLPDIKIEEAGANDGGQENKLTFTWDLGNGEKFEGKELKYIFKEPGAYTITLKASAGLASDEAIATIWVVEYMDNLRILNKHNCIVEVEYILQNNGPGNLKDVTCGVDIPTVIEPFQEINSITTELKDYKEKKDKNSNTFYKFYLGKISDGSSRSVKALYDVTMTEFDLKDDITNPESYDEDIYKKELKQYTKSDKYIDSNNEAIIETVKQVVGTETVPYKIAEKLYSFVKNKLEYDYEKFAQKSRKTNKASELLNLDKGVCQDYSILYAALCRAADIPAKYVAGAPIRSIAYEESREISDGHAWNEINLPGLGWVPIDTTAEKEFMSENNSLNLKTYYDVSPKDLGFLYYSDNTKPQCTVNYLFRVKDIGPSDFSAITNQQYFDMVGDLTNNK
ncbi:MAG: PKD domain-containing protein [Actinobacteria bacterium]|nr:PKD domain-containing protein [Actinomycetota bacterium]